jgi:hypothetical protein
MYFMNSSRILAVPSSEPVEPTRLSDSELIVATRLLVGRSNQLLAALLVHLAEVEARGVHRSRACSSLYAYCIYELRFSEDEAYRRVAAARLVRRFPLLRDAIATGELHLTGLLMLGRHLTEQNLVEVLARAKHRTKKEIARLLRLLDPLPDVPSRIEPLGPAPARLVPKAPTWSEFVQSTCPVRELEPGDRPGDWTEKAGERANDVTESEDDREKAVNEGEGAREAQLEEARPPEPPPTPAPESLAPQRFCVQFTASEEYVKLVEEARALLSHSTPRLALDDLHLRALRAFVAELKRRKYAVTKRPRKPTADSADLEPSPTALLRGSPSFEDRAARRSASNLTAAADQALRVESVGSIEESGRQPVVPRGRGRYVPAEVRRAVFERDEARCTFIDSSGQRCRETHHLELHHVLAFARGGESTAKNLTLRCQAHNALAAEGDFGRDFVDAARASPPHDPWPK